MPQPSEHPQAFGGVLPDAASDDSTQEVRTGRIARSVSLTAEDVATIEAVKIEHNLKSDSAAIRRLIRDALMFRRIQNQIADYGAQSR